MFPEVYALVYVLLLLTFLLVGANILGIVTWGTLKIARLLAKHW
jgi:hypothetical protein